MVLGINHTSVTLYTVWGWCQPHQEQKAVQQIERMQGAVQQMHRTQGQQKGAST